MPTVNTLVMTEFSDEKNSRTWYLPGHTTSNPELAIQKRKIPTGNSLTEIQQSSLKVVYGTEDAAGDPMLQKVSCEVIVRYPVGALTADVDACVDDFQLLVASTEFDSLVDKQAYLG